MARKTVIHFTDDMDGTEAEGTVSFSLDGVNYEIDLNSKNKAALIKALAPFVESARRVGRGKVVPISSARSASQPKIDRELNNLIRKWAKDHGHALGNKGRMPRVVVEAYENNDPTMLPGYKAPNVAAVSADPGAGETRVKTEGVPKPRKSAARSAAGQGG